MIIDEVMQRAASGRRIGDEAALGLAAIADPRELMPFAAQLRDRAMAGSCPTRARFSSR